MSLKFHLLALCLLGAGLIGVAEGQEVDLDDFVVTGHAGRLGEDCFRLTYPMDWSNGAIWFEEAIDIGGSFAMELEMMFGCQDEIGADGIVFVFSPYQGLTGYSGEGMGFAGLQPSLGIEIDTWENDHLADPIEDHVALLQDGFVHHHYNLVGPIKIKNVEDCLLHKVHIRWDADRHLLQMSLDGQQVIAHRIDLVQEVFQGSPKVFWGVTAATGRYNNRQEICFKRLEFTPSLEGLAFSPSLKQRLIKGEVRTLKDVEFQSGSDLLLQASHPELQKLVHLLRENPEMDLDIEGHTDSAGSEEVNKRLSLKRAAAVADYLVTQGIARKRLHVKGIGERFPVADNSTPEGRKRNRRVDIRLFKRMV